MSKISPYDFRGVPPEVIDFKDEVTSLLNFGKYSSLVVGSPPTWTARNGEFVFFNSSGVTRNYFYNNTAWNYLETSTIGGNVVNVSNNLVTISNNLDTQTTRLTNVSNNLVTISNNLDTQTTRLSNVSNNLITISNNLDTQTTRLSNVSNNLVTVSNNLDTQTTRLSNVSNNLVTVSNNLATGNLKTWANLNARVPSIRGSFNVTSFTRLALGSYSLAFTNAFQNTGYTMSYAAQDTAGRTVSLMKELSLGLGAISFVTTGPADDGNADRDILQIMLSGSM